MRKSKAASCVKGRKTAWERCEAQTETQEVTWFDCRDNKYFYPKMSEFLHKSMAELDISVLMKGTTVEVADSNKGLCYLKQKLL